MQKYKSLFFSLLLFLYACSGNNPPKGIIDEVTMAGLLTEIHIADGSMFNTVQIPDSLYKYGTGRYLAVFKNFHTDSVQFRKSMKYYANRPEELEKIYLQVKVNINQKTDSLNKVNQAQIARDAKRRADSIKKLPPRPVGQGLPAVSPPLQTPAKPFVNKRFIPIKRRKNVVPN
jgi:hypothetical protein